MKKRIYIETNREIPLQRTIRKNHYHPLEYLTMLNRKRRNIPIDKISPSELRIRQIELLNDYIEYAKRHSVYWGDMLSGITIKREEDVQRIPTIDKKDFLQHHVAHLDRMISEGIPTTEIKTPMMTIPLAGCEIWRTSASSGTPSVIVRLPEEMDAQDEVTGRMLLYWLKDTDRVANLCVPAGGWSGFLYYRGSLNFARITTEALGSNYSDEYILNDLHRFQFNALISTPTPLADYLTRLEKTDQIDKFPHIEKYIYSGEPPNAFVWTHKGSFPLLTYLKMIWNTPSISLYSGTEPGIVGFPLCIHTADKASFHTIDDTGYIEFLDDSLTPASFGTDAQLIVSRFDNVGVPLIRFRTGDAVIYDQDVCVCGKGGRVYHFSEIYRIDDALHVSSYNIGGAGKVVKEIGEKYHVNCQLITEPSSENVGQKKWIFRIENPLFDVSEHQKTILHELQTGLLSLIQDTTLREQAKQSELVLEIGQLIRTSNGKLRYVINTM